MVINGLETVVNVDDHLIHDILLPELNRVATQRSGQSRGFVFFSAPPGAGKSTIAAILEQHSGSLDLDTIGIDGFHYPNSYLETHHLSADPDILLKDVKGAPETFDVAALAHHLRESTRRDVKWPVYDRTTHDVVPDGKTIRSSLVLVEGNWLLLDEPGWRDLSDHSAFNIFLEAEPELLRERLIERKIQGGMDSASATRFYDTSDRHNVERVLDGTDRRQVDLLLRLQPDGTIEPIEIPKEGMK